MPQKPHTQSAGLSSAYEAAIDVSIMILELLKCRQLKTLGITYENKRERTPKGGEKADWFGTLAPEE